MLRTIFVPLDGSPLAEHALGYAERLAEATSARIILSRVVPLNIIEPPEEDLELAQEARTYLAQIPARQTTTGRVVKNITEWGDPSNCIVDQVDTNQVDLIVMGTHGRSGPGRWLYGSVADTVLRASHVPVALVPPAATIDWPAGHLSRILVPLDGSSLAEAAIPFAVDLARIVGSEILLLQVVPFPPYMLYDDGMAMTAFEPDKELAAAEAYLAGVAVGLTAAGIQVQTRAELAQPAAAIAEIAGQEKAGLIVMATHGRSGFARLALGSVATGTLQRATVPLMLLGPRAVLDAVPAAELAGVSG